MDDPHHGLIERGFLHERINSLSRLLLSAFNSHTAILRATEFAAAGALQAEIMNDVFSMSRICLKLLTGCIKSHDSVQHPDLLELVVVATHQLALDLVSFA